MSVQIVIRSALFFVVVLLAGCETASKTFSSLGNGFNFSEQTTQTFRATGYAPISKQPGKSKGEKVINAIRASKLRAYQELTAVVHGQYVSSSSTVRDQVLVNDNFRTAVSGIVRGARVVKSYPIQDDVYATILEISSNQLQRAWIVNDN